MFWWSTMMSTAQSYSVCCWRLEGWGHRPRVVHDGAAAFAAVGERRPDTVVLDIGLPGIDGYEVCRQLRRTPGLTVGECTLIALTGYGQASDEALARDAGFDAFLVKPVDATRLRALLG